MLHVADSGKIQREAWKNPVRTGKDDPISDIAQ
jgi:hypothetical protein